ncbi:hypothetical protein A3A38_01920 [Candidatus Kaiserbacteria bacterium RIFCSPLOWO2_01_FULL_53_17]|uniref:Uncharacterized protein n=1 Tax=Candidatus Kaiserbacteria bacterium RIFCSPLOWO2_01_FULL_53_17 TaxID=1798511 RepID=A0A1F6EHD8_9BACT|nr:MAG: hypothetical protein A3A38_01920 [Candidatus Kaiserbacteria bacterium RIFCSPLOWO2_01_FULL_53_17]
MFTVGQKVCLWHIGRRNGLTVPVLKEVIVTITEVKTDVPNEVSGKPMSDQSLRGTGDDGKPYEKHWDSWPEEQLRDFATSWSMREDGATESDPFPDWIPREAVHAYNSMVLYRKHHIGADEQVVLLDSTGQPAKPKGDITHCATHDRYQHAGTECFHCLMARRKKSA